MSLPALSSLADPDLLSTRPEAAGYFAANARRYERALELLRARVEFSSCLDIGAGPQTLLFAREFPTARIDTLGTYWDTLYASAGKSTHIPFDLTECANAVGWPADGVGYDLVVFMEVLEHLLVSPQSVFEFLVSRLRPGGTILFTTPNGARLRNRLLWLRGESPYFLPKTGEREHGHLREYTTQELDEAIRASGLAVERHSIENLYRFPGWKNRALARFSNCLPPSFRGIHVYLLKKPD